MPIRGACNEKGGLAIWSCREEGGRGAEGSCGVVWGVAGV